MEPVASMSDLPPSSPPSSSDNGGDDISEGGPDTRYTVPQRMWTNHPKYRSNKGFAARGHTRESVCFHIAHLILLLMCCRVRLGPCQKCGDPMCNDPRCDHLPNPDECDFCGELLTLCDCDDGPIENSTDLE